MLRRMKRSLVDGLARLVWANVFRVTMGSGVQFYGSPPPHFSVGPPDRRRRRHLPQRSSAFISGSASGRRVTNWIADIH